MPRVLPNTTTADAYPNPGAGGAQVGIGDKFSNGYLVVANAAVFGQYFHGLQGQGDPSADIFMPPGTYPLIGTAKDPVSGIRFKSAVAGTPAQVFGVLFYPDEAQMLSSAEFSATVTPSGGTSPGGGSTATYMTLATFAALTPSDGLEVYLVVDAANSIVWHLRYNAGSANADKWEFLGGDPMTNFVETAETCATQAPAYGNVATVGPSLTVPRSGVYLLQWGAKMSIGHAGGLASMAPDMGGTAASGSVDAASGASNVSGMRTYVKTALITNDLIRAKYQTDSAGFPTTFSQRWLSMLPVRIS